MQCLHWLKHWTQFIITMGLFTFSTFSPKSGYAIAARLEGGSWNHQIIYCYVLAQSSGPPPYGVPHFQSCIISGHSSQVIPGLYFMAVRTNKIRCWFPFLKIISKSASQLFWNPRDHHSMKTGVQRNSPVVPGRVPCVMGMGGWCAKTLRSAFNESWIWSILTMIVPSSEWRCAHRRFNDDLPIVRVEIFSLPSRQSDPAEMTSGHRQSNICMNL